MKEEIGASASADAYRNAILGALPQAERETALSGGEMVTFVIRQFVYGPELPIDAAYFPVDNVLSVVTHMLDGSMIEIGTIGREGTTGIPLMMGATTTANESFCQVPGRAWKMPAPVFRHMLDGSKAFRELMNRYLQGYINMLGQLSACNRLHSVYERCARWLLMTQDRVECDQFPLTHEFLATMLGSRRSGVTIAASTLQKAGYIDYERGHITILNRSGLEDATCECYALTQRQFNDMLELRAEASRA